MNTIPFKKLLGTTDKFVRILDMNGITTPTDLLWYLPRTYEDRSVIKTLAQVTHDNGTQVIKGKIVKKSMIRTPRGKQLVELQFVDEQEQRGHILAMHSSFLLRSTKLQARYYIVGKVVREQGKHTFRYPTLIEAKATDEEQETEV